MRFWSVLEDSLDAGVKAAAQDLAVDVGLCVLDDFVAVVGAIAIEPAAAVAEGISEAVYAMVEEVDEADVVAADRHGYEIFILTYQ